MAAGADPCSSPSPQTAAPRHRRTCWAPGTVTVLLRPWRALQEQQEHCANLLLFPADANAGNLGGIHRTCCGSKVTTADARGGTKLEMVTSRWTVSFCLSRKSKEP